MDDRPFGDLSSAAYDVYMLYDYRRLATFPDIEVLAREYEQVHLVGWSMGVWVGQKLFADKRDLFDRTIAINGTLCPIHDDFGIPKQVFAATLADFGENARGKFYKRMCREKANLGKFLARPPQRTIEDQREELAVLQNMVDCLPAEDSIYQTIIISESDLIVPSANQFVFWQGRQVMPVSGFHFLFNLWQSWDQLLDFSDAVFQG